MTPGALDMAREAVRDTDAAQMARVAAQLVRFDTAQDAERCLAASLAPGQRDAMVTR
jgi:hypothetical protein